jgi:tRNA threonylcarbamoyladenosine biosynthesis protein TsaE
MELQVSLDRLNDFAARFWKEIGTATVVLFHGSMGAGKTTIIAALCRAKGVRDAVSSPTFSIINEYAYEEHGVLKKLFHMDLYRLKGEEEVVQAGVEDAVYSGTMCFVEWPEKAPGLFDENAVHVVIEPVSATERAVKILSGTAFRHLPATHLP